MVFQPVYFFTATINSWNPLLIEDKYKMIIPGRGSAAQNKYLYNAGSELNTTTNNYQTFFRDGVYPSVAQRRRDPALGRMTGVDVVAGKYSSVTPYNYAFNDPVGLNDPSGADPWGPNNLGNWQQQGGDMYDTRTPPIWRNFVTN